MSDNFRIIPLGGENMVVVPQGFGGVIDVTLDDGRRYRITVDAMGLGPLLALGIVRLVLHV